MSAWERRDPSQLVALLREDVRMTMPPHPTWYEGRDAVVAFLAERAFAPTASLHRFVPTRANRQPAFGVYRGDRAAAPFAIHVVGIEDGLVTDLDWFLYPGLFPAFGLPDTLT
jgi:RNA polymerase sigma-70 factor, ECF subfamily